MKGLFAITLFIAAGVVSGCERKEVKRGEVVLVKNMSGLENLISRVTLSEEQSAADCKPAGADYTYYCSPKEKERGCTIKNSSIFSMDIVKDGVFLTPLVASDGYYVASITFGNNNVETISILVNGTRTISPDPPPSQETPGTVYRSTLVIIAVCSAVGIIALCSAVGIIAVGIIAVCIFAWWCLKKKKNNESEASDRKKDYIKGEPTTAVSLEMLDQTPPSKDEDSNILNEVLIHNTSVGQENGRPGQHLQNNNYSEDEDDNCKHNNTNNYCDSNFCSNDEDGDDDEIESNNTNNYVNNNNDDGVSNGDYDDDGISSGVDSRNGSNDYF